MGQFLFNFGFSNIKDRVNFNDINRKSEDVLLGTPTHNRTMVVLRELYKCAIIPNAHKLPMHYQNIRNGTTQ